MEPPAKEPSQAVTEMLQRHYRGVMPARIQELESAYDIEHRDAAAIREIAHGLRGSGGTYGFPEVTRAAAALEDADAAAFDPAFHELIATLTRVADEDAGMAAAALGSRVDRLTDLPNQIAFQEQFERAVSQAMRSCESLAVGIIELDRLDMLTDTHGVEAGDAVLRGCAQLIADSLRKADLLARWEGTAFVALLPTSDAAGGAEGLRKALTTVSAAGFPMPDGQSLHMTFCAGVADVLDCVTADEAIMKASHLLAKAKRAGAGQVIAATDLTGTAVRRVLLAEDDELVASVIRHRLGLDGIDVLHFTAGDEALEAAKSTQVSLIILDVRMPGMDGFDVLRELHRTPSLARIPVIMLTSNASDADVVRGFELGASDYVIKPFSPVELLARVNRLLPQT